MTTQTESHTRLHGRWLLLARLAWAVVFITLTAMYAFGVLAVREALSTVCEEELCTLRQQIRHTEAGEKVESYPGPPVGYADRLRPHQVKALGTLGMTLNRYSWLGALEMGLPALVYLLIAGALFWRKSDNWTVMFVSMTVATFPLQNMPLPFTLAVRQPAWEWVVDLGGLVALSCFLILPLIFPTGRFVPRWTRWKALLDIACGIIVMLFQNSITDKSVASNLLVSYLLISLGIGVYAQLYRYFRMAGSLERQQIKWGIVGLAGFVSIAMVILIPLDTLITNRATSMDPAQALRSSSSKAMIR